MSLHPLAEHFDAVAQAYERGRPGYAPAAVGALAAELGLAPGARVLDLAAGTGKLTTALLAGGLDVIAVEPQASLRAVLAGHVGEERVVAGLAEAIPLPDASVDAVTVADAFHWFDHAPALAEIGRVLAPGGGLAVLSTGPDWSGASWAAGVTALMNDARPEHPYFEGPSWREAVVAAGWTAPREIHVTTFTEPRPELFPDYLASMSWVEAMGEAQREAFLRQVRALISAGTSPAVLPVRAVIGLTAPA